MTPDESYSRRKSRRGRLLVALVGNTDPVLPAAARSWADRHGRTTWEPVAADGDAGPLASKFGGRPALEPGESPPVCVACGRSLDLFLQLDLAAAPAAADTGGAGLLQLFYCRCDGLGPSYHPQGETQQESDRLLREVLSLGTDSVANADVLAELLEKHRQKSTEAAAAVGGSDPETWRYFSTGAVLCRVIDPATAVPGPADHGTVPPRRIVEWEEGVDFPADDDAERAGRDYLAPWDADDGVARLTFRDSGVVLTGPEAEAADDYLGASAGDKLGGWPLWFQGANRPACPECGATMQLLFQVGSEDNLPHRFGDLGVGHIMQCPTHRRVVAFGHQS